MTTPSLPPPTHAIILNTEERAMLMSQIDNKLRNGEWLDFDTVASITGLHRVLLRKLVRDQVLPGSAPYRTEKVEGSCDLDTARKIAEQLYAARRSVEGQGMTAIAAGKKYGFSRNNVYNWCERGWVRTVGTTPEGDRLYNEGDIAFARALADLVGNVAGKPLLPTKE